MAAAQAGMKLVRWLANQGDDVVASAEDLARFGPQAARVRGLLDFLPTMSDEATRVSGAAADAPWDAARGAEVRAARGVAGRAARGAEVRAAWDDVWDAARDAVWDDAWDAAGRAAGRAAWGEVINDLTTPEVYRTLTNPLAAGRAVDLLRSRPRYQGTPFLDVVRQAAERGAVRGPRDVIAAGRIARSPEDIREIALTLMADGMPAEEAMRTAAML